MLGNDDKTNEIISVADWFKWRESNQKSVEAQNEQEIKSLGWDYADVLYSFLGIYAIGVWVNNKQNYRVTDCMIKTNSSSPKAANIYSIKYLNQHHSDQENKSLNELPEMKNFLKAYYSIGNITPIWPGGNVHKGRSYCFDLPNIYFTRNEKWTKALQDLYSNANLDEVLAYNAFDSTKKFLDSFKSKKDYAAFLQNIVKIINNRAEKLNQLLS